MILRQREVVRNKHFSGYKRPRLQHDTPFSQTILGESLFLPNRSRTNSRQTHVKNSIPDSLRAPEKIFQQYQYSLIFKRNRVQSACGMHPDKSTPLPTETHRFSEFFHSHRQIKVKEAESGREREDKKKKGRESGEYPGNYPGKHSGKDDNAKERKVSLLCETQTKSFMPSARTRSKSATSRFF